MRMIEQPCFQNHAECVQAVRRYIGQHLDEPLRREEIAAIAGFSVPHLHRLFIGEVGMSPAAYIRRMRMLRAGYKLRMGAVDINEVALAAGYATHAAFAKAFKKQFKLSPAAFRQLGCTAATQLLRKERVE